MHEILNTPLFTRASKFTIIPAGVIAAVISFWHGLYGAAVLLAGAIFGLAILASIVHATHQMTPNSEEDSRVSGPSVLLKVAKWIVVVVILYFVCRSGVQWASIFIGGYTLSLIGLIAGAACRSDDSSDSQTTESGHIKSETGECV